MSRIVIVAYRPFPGKEDALKELLTDHVPILKKEDLVTDRAPVIMRAADGAFVEIFEWRSAEAIENAHNNAAVQDLWQRFSEVCEYEIPMNVAEFSNMFSEFEAIN